MDTTKEFQSYYTKHLGKGSLDLHYYNQRIENSMTPYILEEREMSETLMRLILLELVDETINAINKEDLTLAKDYLKKFQL